MKSEVFKTGEDTYFCTPDNDTLFPEHFDIPLPTSSPPLSAPATELHTHISRMPPTLYTRDKQICRFSPLFGRASELSIRIIDNPLSQPTEIDKKILIRKNNDPTYRPIAHS